MREAETQTTIEWECPYKTCGHINSEEDPYLEEEMPCDKCHRVSKLI